MAVSRAAEPANMNKIRDYRTEIEIATDQKRDLESRERMLLLVFVFSVVAAFSAGIMNGIYVLGGWEIVVPVMTIANYIIYYFWSAAQLKKYEVEHRTLGYYANDKKAIPAHQLQAYDQLKYEYILDMLKNTTIIAVLCGGLVFAGQKVVGGSSLWWIIIVLLPIGIAVIMQNQKHQINRFGKNGNKIMSRNGF